MLDFVAGCRLDGPRWRYSREVTQPTLYSSCYAALTLSLCGELDGLALSEREAWLAWLDVHQDDDGLYRDPVIFGQGWYADDPLWCGRTHLTCHVLPALAALGGVARREFTWLRPYADPDRVTRWLDGLDFGARVAWSGNEILNVGTLLQYARDRHHDDAAGRAVTALLDWLDTHHLDPATGLWGPPVTDRIRLSHGVQAAYHWWLLYFYDGRPVPYPERAVDSVLATRNQLGGFGCGTHHPSDPDRGSACEDIDSIDPLARLSYVTGHRADEVREALAGAVAWVRSTRTADGGFPFVPGEPFAYGHPELSAGAGVGAMFPTWFRTLSVALAEQALTAAEQPATWRFVDCPGYQFAPGT